MMHLRSFWLTAIFLVVSCSVVQSQMWNGADSLYGNEWIRFNQSYYKIKIADDGVYRITYQTLINSGLPLSEIEGSRFQLYCLGKEVPVYLSTNGLLSDTDFIEFYGKKNRGELDGFMYSNPGAEQLNPEYSMVTDTAAYFLTWAPAGTPTLRYTDTPNDLSNLPPAEDWFWSRDLRVFNNRYLQRAYKFEEDISESIYDEGEGYGGNYANDQTVTFTPKFPFAAQEQAQVDIRFVASRDQAHQMQVKWPGINDTLLVFTGYDMRQLILRKNAALITASEPVNIKGLVDGSDRYALGFAQLEYPRAWNADNQKYIEGRLSANGLQQYIELGNFQAENTAPIFYDLSNRYRIVADWSGGLVKVKLPAANSTRSFAVVNAISGIRQVSQLSPVTFVQYAPADAEFLIVSHSFFFNDGQGNNWVQAYADYRQSIAGGQRITVVADVQQLYDQFAYGLNRHPLAIRNLAHYAQKHWRNFKYLFIIGKGREPQLVRTATQLAGAPTFFVPTWGSPGSDTQLACRLDSPVPVVPVGRLAATSPLHVKWYLDKISAHENPADLSEAGRAWHKEVIHLGGGGSASEQASIRQALQQMEEEIESNAFGGDVHSFFKTSSDPIQQAVSEELTNRINNGAALITFFGHAGTGGFDFSIDNPATYQNQGKYPVVSSLGCLSGQIHTNVTSVAEQFVLQENKGALAFFATVGYGFITSLTSVNQEFYRRLGGADYGKGIGDVLKSCIDRFKASTFIGNKVLLQQFTLNGDPSVVVSVGAAPDFLLKAADVQFIPNPINAQQDSFTLRFGLYNIGKAVSDSIVVKINRQMPGGVPFPVQQWKVESPKYKADLALRLPVLGESAVGFNRIFIEADEGNLVAEWPSPEAEQNNLLLDGQGNQGVDFYVFSNSAIPVYPPHFGIAGTQPLVLKANTTNALAPLQRYFMELDTTALFNSPFKKSKELYQSGGLLEWAPDGVNWQDSTVYYWRVSADTSGQPGFTWRYSSFVYLNGTTEGWWQSHYYQYAENRFQNLELPADSRTFKYLDDLKTIRVRNLIIADQINLPGVSVNNDPYGFLIYDQPVYQGLYVFVFDSLTINPWINTYPGQYGSHLGSPWAYWAHFPYRTTNAGDREKAITMLKDIIPSGNYVLIYTAQTTTAGYKPEEWAADSLSLGVNLFQVLEAQGAQLLRSTATGGAKPYVFFYKKDDPAFTPYEYLGDSTELIEKTFYVAGLWNEGQVSTQKLGPARSWHRLQWKVKDIQPQDFQHINLYGVRADSTAVLLATGLNSSDTTLEWVNAQEYPFLRLEFYSKDTLLRSSPQLGYWTVQYSGLPEAALATQALFDFQKDTLQQGESLRLDIAAANISTINMDSLLFRFSVLDPANALQISQDIRVAPLAANDSLQLRWNADTRNWRGPLRLFVDMNPDEDQPELYHFNNIAVKDFYVERDRRNPLLDVTFDGMHIMDRDLVSARPQIVIRLKDENPFLPLGDTSAVKVLLRRPGSVDVEEVPFAGGELRFFPASGNNNAAVVEWNPHFTESGLYALVVQGRDASGNVSGQLDYEVSFEVITEARLSNVLNYPNPFSTSTQFVYTLTGEAPPSYFAIEIMTISGRIVRTLTQDNLGPLRVGTHRTDFAWDGTDDYGDKLANGVYLYRIIAKDTLGKNFEQYDTGTDAFFKNKLGKLVILR